MAWMVFRQTADAKTALMLPKQFLGNQMSKYDTQLTIIMRTLNSLLFIKCDFVNTNTCEFFFRIQFFFVGFKWAVRLLSMMCRWFATHLFFVCVFRGGISIECDDVWLSSLADLLLLDGFHLELFFFAHISINWQNSNCFHNSHDRNLSNF